MATNDATTIRLSVAADMLRLEAKLRMIDSHRCVPADRAAIAALRDGRTELTDHVDARV